MGNKRCQGYQRENRLGAQLYQLLKFLCFYLIKKYNLWCRSLVHWFNEQDWVSVGVSQGSHLQPTCLTLSDLYSSKLTPLSHPFLLTMPVVGLLLQTGYYGFKVGYV